MLLSFLTSSCSRKKENTIPQKAKSAERDKIKGFCMTHTYKARQKSSEGLFTFDVFSESRVMYSEIWNDIMRAISLYISTVYDNKYEHEKVGTKNNIQKDKSLNMKELLVWKCTLVSILVYCMIKFWDSVINIALNT